MPEHDKPITLRQALDAQKALRDMAGLKEEVFPIPAFVGMVSDEIEALRKRGSNDEQIAAAIQKTGITISASQIAEFYAPPDERQHGHK